MFGAARGVLESSVDRSLPADSGEENGAGDRDRTGDVQLGKLAFYR